MQHSDFEIVLEQPVIISEQAASAGAHQSLDYLPGAVLLGLAASRLYAELGAEHAWTLFHSGLVRFGDALPCRDGETGQPMPFSWHHYKGELPGRDDRLLAESLFDAGRGEVEPTRQPQQLRAGYVTASGRLLRPARIQVLKTAIDRDTGMAAESQLFGYSALSAGQRFRCRLSADAAVDSGLWQTLCQRLEGMARLGRSRSAQFGRVRIQRLPAVAAPPAPADDGTRLTLWLHSDLLLSEHGQPCLIPHPHLLGLPAGSRLLLDTSFLRGRRYSPYNAYRRHYDSERQVISRGSVLRYELPRALSEDERRALQAGLGLHIEAGLGAVAVNPVLLAQRQPQFAAVPQVAAKVDAATTQPAGSVLIQALYARLRRRIGDVEPERIARDLFDGLCRRVREARGYAALAPGEALEAPGRSQWGRIKQLASDLRDDRASLRAALVDRNTGILRKRSGWQQRYGPRPNDTFSTWLSAELESLHEREDFDRIVGHLAAFGLQPAWIACCEGREKPAAARKPEEQGA